MMVVAFTCAREGVRERQSNDEKECERSRTKNLTQKKIWIWNPHISDEKNCITIKMNVTFSYTHWRVVSRYMRPICTHLIRDLDIILLLALSHSFFPLFWKKKFFVLFFNVVHLLFFMLCWSNSFLEPVNRQSYTHTHLYMCNRRY